MFGISGIEFLFIAVLVLILFGPDKLPQFGRTIGQMLRQFNEAKDQVEHVMRTEMYGGSDAGSSPFSPSSPFAPAQTQAPAPPAEKPAKREVEFVEDEEAEEE